MGVESPCWYIPGKGKQPIGPLTTEQITQALQTGRVMLDTICWREGMTQWLPLSQVEPFASVAASVNSPHRNGPASPTELQSPTADASSLRHRVPSSRIGLIIAGGIGAILFIIAGGIGIWHLALPRRAANHVESGASCNRGMRGDETGKEGYQLAFEWDGGNPGNPESIRMNHGLKVTVKGPPAKLYVLIYDAQGKQMDSQDTLWNTIEADAMRISNSASVTCDWSFFQNGGNMYTILLRDDKEHVLAKKVVTLTRNTDSDWKVEETTSSKSPPSFDTHPPRKKKNALSPKPTKPDAPRITGKKSPSRSQDPSAVPSAELGAPPLKNGLLIGQSLSVAVAAYQRHAAGSQTGFFSTEVTGLSITLAFRRVGVAFVDPQLDIIVTDDRGNEYRSLHRSPRSRVLCSGRIPAASELRGAPTWLGQMPVGFTWTSEFVVEMPPAAPVAKVELEYSLPSGNMFQNPRKHRVPLDIANPAMPGFEFAIPSKLVLDEGSTIEAGKDIQGKIGRLTVRNSFISKGASGLDTPKTVKGLALTLSIELANQDYNKREAVVPRLAIQFADGETLETSDNDMLQNVEVKEDPKFLDGLPVIDIPGGSSRTLLLHVNVAASMKGKAGSKLNGLLLYVKNTFCGFVRIPEDVNTAIARIGAAEPQPQSSAPDGATPSDDDQSVSKHMLSGNWRASAGATFRLKDDGTVVTIELIQGNPLMDFSGELSRGDGDSDSKTLTGTITATFKSNSSKKYSIRVKVTINDPDHLRVRCSDWPIINNAGRNVGRKTLNESWTRIGDGSAKHSQPNQPSAPSPPAPRHR